MPLRYATSLAATLPHYYNSEEMQTTPLLSVIVLTYNQKETAKRAIASVWAACQGVDCEIVMSDDDSTDGTREVLEHFADRCPVMRLLPRHPNLGPVLNYFHALKECRGRYIGDCAGDDMWADTANIASRLEGMENHPERVLDYADVRHHPDSAFREPKHYPTSQRLLEALLAHETPTPVVLSACLYRRSTLKALMAQAPDMICNPKFGCEDMPILAALIHHGFVQHTKTEALIYTLGYDTVSRPKDPGRASLYMLRTIRATIALAARYIDYNAPRIDRWLGRRLHDLHRLAVLHPETCTEHYREARDLCLNRGLHLPVWLWLKLHLPDSALRRLIWWRR